MRLILLLLLLNIYYIIAQEVKATIKVALRPDSGWFPFSYGPTMAFEQFTIYSKSTDNASLILSIADNSDDQFIIWNGETLIGTTDKRSAKDVYDQSKDIELTGSWLLERKKSAEEHLIWIQVIEKAAQSSGIALIRVDSGCVIDGQSTKYLSSRFSTNSTSNNEYDHIQIARCCEIYGKCNNVVNWLK